MAPCIICYKKKSRNHPHGHQWTWSSKSQYRNMCDIAMRNGQRARPGKLVKWLLSYLEVGKQIRRCAYIHWSQWGKATVVKQQFLFLVFCYCWYLDAQLFQQTRMLNVNATQTHTSTAGMETASGLIPSAFSNTTLQKHQFFIAQPSSQSNSHIHTWPQGKP